MRSEFEDHWIEGCREGLAIAHDLLAGSIKDIAIRSNFKPRPIKLRYHDGADRTVKDEGLIAPDPDPYSER